jgi:hypothetical protein
MKIKQVNNPVFLYIYLKYNHYVIGGYMKDYIIDILNSIALLEEITSYYQDEIEDNYVNIFIFRGEFYELFYFWE